MQWSRIATQSFSHDINWYLIWLSPGEGYSCSEDAPTTYTSHPSQTGRRPCGQITLMEGIKNAVKTYRNLNLCHFHFCLVNNLGSILVYSRLSRLYYKVLAWVKIAVKLGLRKIPPCIVCWIAVKVVSKHKWP